VTRTDPREAYFVLLLRINDSFAAFTQGTRGLSKDRLEKMEIGISIYTSAVVGGGLRSNMAQV
jgi:hypothetical protein